MQTKLLNRYSWLMGLLLVLLPSVIRAAPVATEPPVIPVGLDAYRMWEHWPEQRIGVRAYMRSTYDRRGGNEGADASHFLYQLGDTANVTLDVAGPGVLYFARYNHWHGSPWHYDVDGTDHVVQESSTADPNHPIPGSTFLPQNLFPNPLAWTWDITKGADLLWVPIAFERSLQMAYERTHYGTGYYIYHQYMPGAKLSQPIQAWNGQTPPDNGVLDLINRSGTDIAPQAGTLEGDKIGVRQQTGTLTIPAKAAVTVLDLNAAPATVRALEFTIPRDKSEDFSQAHLRITWDGRPTPSVDAPVALFYGAGSLYNRDGREYLVKAFATHVRFDDAGIHLGCYFPMPFFRSAQIELVGGDAAVEGVQWSVRYAPLTEPINYVTYFHATYKDFPTPEAGRDLVLLDTRETEGGGDWSGNFIGTSWIFSHRAVLGTLEGDPRFFFDDSLTPQAQGTGTEEWGGGGDYWGGQNMTLPFAGHPTGATRPEAAKNDEDKIESAYRFLLADLMPFGNHAVIHLEHGGENQSTEHYETVTYWYGVPSPTLLKTDELDIGSPVSEKEHQYLSPQASPPYNLTSRYEWGVDTLNGKEVYPAAPDRGRTTEGTSEFTLRLVRNNLGVLLRRKLDYSYPNQRAEFYVADAGASNSPAAWQLAGIWYLAGSNTCVYSNPRDELGAAQHNVQTSNRRFRDDEFMIPRSLTEGRSAIRVRVKFTPVNLPLFPGQPIPELAWSEMRYTAYCYAMPQLKLGAVAAAP
ncbi:MAG: DUF2961 domain-containing protein [Abitibacteriaceae bacterium]|nr:DUF2961 domain-containing protein [Abditibacteriaceae bacterium]MBV9868652.1 DUF2961 domain-containing protein [Abditibacteriaceae bacterium]